jgi:hypothetical protein
MDKKRSKKSVKKNKNKNKNINKNINIINVNSNNKRKSRRQPSNVKSQAPSITISNIHPPAQIHAPTAPLMNQYQPYIPNSGVSMFGSQVPNTTSGLMPSVQAPQGLQPSTPVVPKLDISKLSGRSSGSEHESIQSSRSYYADSEEIKIKPTRKLVTPKKPNTPAPLQQPSPRVISTRTIEANAIAMPVKNIDDLSPAEFGSGAPSGAGPIFESQIPTSAGAEISGPTTRSKTTKEKGKITDEARIQEFRDLKDYYRQLGGTDTQFNQGSRTNKLRNDLLKEIKGLESVAFDKHLQEYKELGGDNQKILNLLKTRENIQKIALKNEKLKNQKPSEPSKK